MTFRDYCSLIAQSVAETGYNQFRPSACIPSRTKDAFHVLECELSEEGEESAALSWAKSLSKNLSTTFVAFRGGGRRIAVVELKANAVVDGIVIHVNPHSEASS